MRTVIIKSLVIGFIFALIGNIAADILFAKRVEPFIFSMEEIEENNQLTLGEYAEKYKNPKVISGLDYVLSYPMDWFFWKNKFKAFFFYYAMMFLSCLSFGLWKSNKKDT